MADSQLALAAKQARELLETSHIVKERFEAACDKHAADVSAFKTRWTTIHDWNMAVLAAMVPSAEAYLENPMNAHMDLDALAADMESLIGGCLNYAPTWKLKRLAPVARATDDASRSSSDASDTATESE